MDSILINDLFDFFWLHTVPGNVLNVVVIPLRLQLPSPDLGSNPELTSYASNTAVQSPLICILIP